jgi:hypothetical protein
MKYYLYNYENGREHLIAQGSTKESVRSVVENSPDFFKNGYAIYEVNVVEYNPGVAQF